MPTFFVLAGIYIHIPFCRQACVYCNFHFKVGSKNTLSLTNAIAKELELKKALLTQPIETIYFGGGTPSYLPDSELQILLQTIHNNYDTSNVSEITLEANPDDITTERLKQWSEMQINRLSIGVQSFFDSHLKWMNRAHNAKEAKQCIEQSLLLGFELNIDLIFGIPISSHIEWAENLRIANEYDIKHLSCYGLTYELNTGWEKLVNLKKYSMPDDTLMQQQFLYAMSFLSENGWKQYEISNYCRENFIAKHNTAYWQHKPYIGVGPSAHSYLYPNRYWNVSDNAKYVESINMLEIPEQMETLTLTQQVNEYIMTSLRTQWGIELHRIDTYKLDTEIFYKTLEKYIVQGYLLKQDNTIKLSTKGKLFTDSISAELFF